MLASDPAFYRDLLLHIRDGVYFVDRDRKILFWNEGAARLTGYSDQEIVGHHCQENILGHMDGCGNSVCGKRCPLSETIRDGQGREMSLFLRHKSGHRVPVLVRVEPIRDKDGKIEGAVEIFSDNTAQAEAARRTEELSRMAFLDHLTQLPNRRFLEMAMKVAFTEHQVHHRPFAFLVADVDCFKDINDQFGHAFGDRVLQEIGLRLLRSLRPRDVVGRWGGDEFVAIIHNIGESELRDLAQRCISLVGRTPIAQAQGGAAEISISIGAARVRENEDSEVLLGRADGLVYASKAAGRGRATAE